MKQRDGSSVLMKIYTFLQLIALSLDKKDEALVFTASKKCNPDIVYFDLEPYYLDRRWYQQFRPYLQQSIHRNSIKNAGNSPFQEIYQYNSEPAFPLNQPQNVSNVIDLNSRKRAGRNDPCPCGSGKKYKKCCGK
ncbi:YecA family protein [Mesobacillus subterraneus]|uniref:YecA family protein n=1 Tax=Mesobacillus subterraneus TaxID=285983 RepID=UPI0024830517|nr:SEC-C metal-binding domain-containing protein [Mesobacillus subterraneus]